MEVTAKELADILDGEIIGDENIKINTFTSIEEGKPGAISFL